MQLPLSLGQLCSRRAWHTLGASLLDALFPPRCGCRAALPLVTQPPYGACNACLFAVERHDGLRCESCDVRLEGSASSVSATLTRAPAARHLLAHGPPLCRECRARPPPFARVRAPFVYGGVLAELIMAAKFSRREDLARALGRLLAADAEVCALAQGATACVPVPLGRSRRATRGYNQSVVMARELGRRLDVPVCHALVRLRETRPQSELGRDARRENVAGAFGGRRGARLRGRVLLVDDVVTSGETARQASRALREVGAEEVIVLAAARSA